MPLLIAFQHESIMINLDFDGGILLAYDLVTLRDSASIPNILGPVQNISTLSM